MQRRAFLVGGMVGTVFVACRSWTRPTARREVATPHELETVAAIAETFLPGGDGTPGAHDAGAAGVIADPANGLNPYISELVSDLDDWCHAMHGGRRFVELDDAEREVALEERMGLRGAAIKSLYLPAYEGMLALTKLAFFGAVAAPFGMSWIGFPGASTGYAPRSAAGAYASAGPVALAAGAISAVEVLGDGRVTSLHVSALVTTPDDAKLALRVVSPDGRGVDIAVDPAGGEGYIDTAVPLTGGPAAGAWRMEVALRGGTGQLALWSLRLRTELDDPGAR